MAVEDQLSSSQQLDFIRSKGIGRKGHGLAINIKESNFIRVNNLTLNRNIGKFNLPRTWNRVLLYTPGLTLKRHVQAVGLIPTPPFNPT